MIVNLPLRNSTRGGGVECFVKFIILKKKHQTIANDAINRIEQEEIVRYFSILLENASRGKKRCMPRNSAICWEHLMKEEKKG